MEFLTQGQREYGIPERKNCSRGSPVYHQVALGVQTTVQTEIEENGPACKNLVQILMSHDHELFVNC